MQGFRVRVESRGCVQFQRLGFSGSGPEEVSGFQGFEVQGAKACTWSPWRFSAFCCLGFRTDEELLMPMMLLMTKMRELRNQFPSPAIPKALSPEPLDILNPLEGLSNSETCQICRVYGSLNPTLFKPFSLQPSGCARAEKVGQPRPRKPWTYLSGRRESASEMVRWTYR